MAKINNLIQLKPMILKIFYSPTIAGATPNSKKVMAMSDGALVGNFPFVEFDAGDDRFHSTESFEVVDEDGFMVAKLLNVYPHDAE